MAADRKSKLESEAARLLKAGVAATVFPGASACIGYREDDSAVFAQAAGGTLQPRGAPVRVDTPYDLGSLTKPFVATSAFRLADQDKLLLDARVDSVLSDVRGGPGGSATMEELLSHRSGLAAWGGFYLDVPHEPGSSAARRWIMNEASRRMELKRGQMLYSDLGYMIAGAVVARAAGTSLDQAVRREVLIPLGIEDAIYYPGALTPERRAALAANTPPTERCSWRGVLVQGEVHDENAAALGGVAGHAGLFGTAKAVARFGLEMLDVLADRSHFVTKERLTRAITSQPGGSYAMGWDRKQAEDSSAGRHLSTDSFGHLGFPGTSIWCDPTRGVVVVLLSNRVHPSRANEKIKGFRPAFHDVVTAIFDQR